MKKMTSEEKYMRAALREAKKAYALGEVPIGCVLVADDKIIARGYNRKKKIKTLSLTRKQMRSARQAKRPATGVWNSAPCT